MKRFLAVAVASVAVATLGSLLLGAGGACTFSIPDGGSGAADSGPAQEVGDQCMTIFAELCTQALTRCGLNGFTLDQCINADMPTCCTGSVCTEISQSSAADVADCTSAIDGEDCNLIVNNNTPPACTGVPAKP